MKKKLPIGTTAKPARATDREQIIQGVAVVGIEKSERCNPR